MYKIMSTLNISLVVLALASYVHSGAIHGYQNIDKNEENLEVNDGEFLEDDTLFPWTVSIQNSEGKHLCTGFIVSLDDGQGSSWVGTAPSCLIDFDDSDEGNQGWKNWLVYVGGYDSADNCKRPAKHCQKLAILENKQHFDFHWSEHRNDITLLKLDGTLQSMNNTKEIDIVPREKKIKVGEPLHFTGFGKTEQTIFNHNTKLNHGIVYLWDVDDCKEALTLFDDRPILETNYCAGQKRANGGWTGSCSTKGDMGGALFTCRGNETRNEDDKPKCDGYWVLEGLASWTTNPCGYNFPGVYTKIDSYIEWINSIVNPTPAPTTTLEPITTEIATTQPATTPVPTTVETTPETTIVVTTPKPTTHDEVVTTATATTTEKTTTKTSTTP